MRALLTFLLLHALTCLERNALGSEITHGHFAPWNQMLYMASAQTRDRHVCGGSLISNNFVLTAAHCADKVRLEKVVLGTHDLRKTGTVRTIVQICKHPGYRKETQENDIMLLKLSHSVPVGGTIQLIPLPPPNMNLQHNQMCHVAGWGWTEDSNKQSVDDLRVVGVSVVDLDVCTRQWAKIRWNLPANVICAGGYQTYKGVCYGDSGGPLVCNGMAVGVSAGVDEYCNDPELPDIYTDVSKFRPWINQILKQQGC